MGLEGITICGADDSIGPHMLALMGKHWPFIEWGILMSRDRVATPRYPSLAWVNKLAKHFEKPPGRGLSAHLCGSFSRVTMRGDETYLATCVPSVFRRVQLNGFEFGQIGTSFHPLTRKYSGFEFILQARTESHVTVAAGIGLCCKPGRVSALYDPSGGRGLFAGDFPDTPAGFHVGFAGGIGPDNVLDILGRIGERSEPFWLCMESGVRTNDEFDRAKVGAVARKVAEYLSLDTRRRLHLTEACA